MKQYTPEDLVTEPTLRLFALTTFHFIMLATPFAFKAIISLIRPFCQVALKASYSAI